MPRKSSFLMGFETGSNVYSRGFNQAQSVAQMALQARQMRISEDAAKQRSKYLDLQMRQLDFTLANKRKQDERHKSANVAMTTLFTGLNAAKTPQAKWETWQLTKDKAEETIRKDPEVWRQYETGKEDYLAETSTMVVKKRAEQSAKADLIKIEAENQRSENKHDIYLAAIKIEPTLEGDPLDPATQVAAQDILNRAKLGPLYISAGLEVPTDWDVNDDGLFSLDDKLAHLRHIENGKLMKDQGIRDRELEVWTAKEQLKLKNQMLADTAKWLRENPDSVGSEGARRRVDRLALSGTAVSDYKTIYQGSVLRQVMSRRSEIETGLQAKKYTGISRLLASGIYTNSLSQTESNSINKALTTREQLNDIDHLLKQIKTGPVQDKLKGVQKLMDTEEGRNKAIFEGALNALIPGLARGIYGEVGVLTDADIRLYKATVASTGQVEAVNAVLIKKTKELVDTSIRRQLDGAVSNRKNVSGYVGQYSDVTGEAIPSSLQTSAVRSQRPDQRPGRTLMAPDAIKSIKQTNFSGPEAHKMAQDRVMMNAMHTNDLRPKDVVINGVPQRLSVGTREDVLNYAKDLHASGFPIFDHDWSDESQRNKEGLGTLRPFVHPEIMAPSAPAPESPPAIEAEPYPRTKKVPPQSPRMLEVRPVDGGEPYFIPADSVKPAPSVQPPSKWTPDLEKALKDLDAVPPSATGEPVPATPTEDTLPPAEPGELPPAPEPGGEGPPNQGAPDLPTEPIPGLPGEKTMSRKEAFRKRRQRLSLKPIIDKIGASELDTGDGMIRIGATDESGVMITRDGKDELMSWDDFEELMDKLGYLK